MVLVLPGVAHNTPGAARTEGRTCDPILHVFLVLLAVAVLFLGLFLFLFVFGGKTPNVVLRSGPAVNAPHGGQHPNTGTASQPRRVGGNGGTISPAFPSGTSCVSGYRGDLMKCHMPPHSRASGLVAFPWDNIGFHTETSTRESAYLTAHICRTCVSAQFLHLYCSI